VQIIGSYEHTPRPAIESAAAPWVTTGFFALEPARVQSALMMLPWVHSVDIRRVWPATVRIILTEKQPIARWGSSYLVTGTAELFASTPYRYPKQLPLILAPNGTEKNVVALFLPMQKALAERGLRLSEAILTPRGAWSLTLDNQVVLVLGRQEPLERLHRFTDAFHRVLGRRLKDAERIDLRYANGIAVKWRAPSQTTQVPEQSLG